MFGLKKLAFVTTGLFILVILWYPVKGFLAEFKQEEHPEPPITHTHEKPEEFVLFTMPKTGTHLMRPLLEYFTDKRSISYWNYEVDCPKRYLYDKNLMDLLLLLPNVVQAYWLHQPIPKDSFISVLDSLKDNDDFLVTHAPFSKEMESTLKERNCVVFFLLRDPRDWVVSVIRHPPISGVDIYGGPIGDPYFLTLDNSQKIDYILSGTSDYYSVADAYDKFLSWRNSSVCCSLCFEALLGPRGGRFSEQQQLVELRKIAKALQLDDVSDEMLVEAFNESFGVGTIFTKSKGSSWQDYFNEEQKDAFKETMGDLLIELGYEDDYNW